MIAWAIETFVATTLLMLLVLALRAPVRKAFGPQIAYALWLLPVIRMAMPPLPGDWQLTRFLAPVARQAEEAPGMAGGILNADTLSPGLAQATLIDARFELAGHHAALAVVPPVPAADGPSVAMLLIGLWVAGAAVFLLYHLFSHSRFCARLLKRARVDRTVAEGRVRVIETDAAHGPLAFGIWRKYVAFPRDFSERYDEVERDLALAHELGHHVRGDLIANWVALVVLALHWFNPVAWRAFRAFRADQEMACDALVLAGRETALRHAYGRAIVKSAHGGAVSAACHLHTINELKGRLRMLSKTRKFSPARIAAGAVGVSALSLAALGLTASGTQAAERIRDRVEAATGIDLSAQDAPAAPEAPEAPIAQEAPEAPVAPKAPAAPEAKDGVKVMSRTVYSYSTGEKGKDRRKVIVTQQGDGPAEHLDLEELQASLPEIRDGKCGTGDGKQPVITRKDGKKTITIICSDRIQAVATASAEIGAKHAEMAVRMAGQYKEMGLRSALLGLKMARRQIESQTSLSAGAKADALNGIDEAIREIENEAKDKD